MASAFEKFLLVRASDLRRISRLTRGDYAFEEVQSEAWIVAIQIGSRRGWAFDFGDQGDQDQLLAWLHNRLVKYADKTVRYAARMDHGRDEDSERTGNTLARLLTAPLESDPEIRRALVEERDAVVEGIQKSYSQAAAYLLLLIRVEGELADLATLLRIGVGTLRERMKRLALLARIQPTLFDGIERHDPALEPWRRTAPARRTTPSPGFLQSAFWARPVS